jgi:8-oxo-dGTP pyrophosphatase MutT (NUDIX family)
VWDDIARLHAHYGDVPPEVGVRKLGEKTGFAELSDMIITAAVAMIGITGDTGQASQAFRRHLDDVLTQAGLQAAPTEQHTARHWTASAIVLHPDRERVLLIDHVKSGYWLFPGGHVAEGETLAEAAVREVREETGVDAQLITGRLPDYEPVTTHPVPFTIIEAMAADPVNGPHQHVDGLFVCQAPTGEIGRLDQREAAGARWIALDEMPALNVPGELPAITRAAISWAAMQGGHAPLSLR